MGRQNTYTLEIVTRYNLAGIPELPHVHLQTGEISNFFTIYHAELTSEYLGFTVARLEQAEKDGQIVSYFYAQGQKERRDDEKVN